MAAVKISELERFTKEEMGDGSQLLIPASKGVDTTKTLNGKEFVENVVLGNIDVWDLETFHDTPSSSPE